MNDTQKEALSGHSLAALDVLKPMLNETKLQILRRDLEDGAVELVHTLRGGEHASLSIYRVVGEGTASRRQRLLILGMNK